MAGESGGMMTVQADWIARGPEASDLVVCQSGSARTGYVGGMPRGFEARVLLVRQPVGHRPTSYLS